MTIYKKMMDDPYNIYVQKLPGQVAALINKPNIFCFLFLVFVKINAKLKLALSPQISLILKGYIFYLIKFVYVLKKKKATLNTIIENKK